jgi:hypothetical protein
MPHPLCQIAAKSWVKNCTFLTTIGLMKVYDRMFQFRLINSPLSPGTEKVGLVVELDDADGIVLARYHSQLTITNHEHTTQYRHQERCI